VFHIYNMYSSTTHCGPAENSSFTLQFPSKYNICGLPLSSPFHPPYTDPLYAPYVDKEYVGPYGCNISKYKSNPPYPVIDPARMRLGEGIKFRSRYDNQCPLGYVMGANQMCYKQDEPIGRFYNREFYMRFPGVFEYRNDLVDEISTKDPRAW
jgi:hypothetical protein